MGKTIERTSHGRSQMVTRISFLTAVSGFVAGLALFANTVPAITLLFSGCAAVGAGLVTSAVLSKLTQPKSKIETSFNFEDAPATQPTRASNFQYEVAVLIHKLTGNRTEIVHNDSDDGVDIKVYDVEDQLVGIVQCQNLAANKTTHPVYIQELNTVRKAHQVKTAYLVSKGRFSIESQKLAQQLGIKLIDGSALTRLSKQTVSV